jgi:PAS domain S-box-containing protein
VTAHLSQLGLSIHPALSSGVPASLRLMSVVLTTLIFLIVFAIPVNAEFRLGDQRNVIFDRLTTGDGLSHAAVTAITQDKFGFIWVGTQEGLSRFDGYKFETFYHLDDQPNSISHHSIWSILCDTNGDLWIGTDAGLNRFDPITKSFEAIVLNGEPVGTKNSVYTMFEDKAGTLWIGTSTGLSARYPDGRIRQYRETDNGDIGIGPRSVRRILQDSSGILWVGTEDNGLYRLDTNIDEFTRVNDIDLLDNYVRDIMEDAEGNIWVSTTSGGITVYRPTEGTLKRFTFNKDEDSSLAANRVRAMLLDDNGDIWVGSDGGLNLYNPDTELFTRYKNDPTDVHSLGDNTVIELFLDEGGVIWVGTFNGISKFNAKTISFPRFRQDATSGGLASNAIASFAEAEADNVWIGTFNGLNKWDAVKGEFLHFPAKDVGLTDDKIMSLGHHQGALWVGTMNGGINLLQNDELVTIMQHDPFDPESVSSNAISRIYVDSRNELWVATYGSGVNRYLGDGRFERFPNRNANGQFSDLKAVDIIEADDGRMWIATDGGGIIVLDPSTGETETFQHDSNNDQSISSNNVISLLNEDGVIWAGTRDRGANRFDVKTEGFKRYSRSAGLASDLVYGILADEQGQLWFSGGKGLSVLDPESGRVQIYDSTHGLQSDDFNSGAFLELSDGTFLFGGNNGFNAFYPERINGNSYVPPVRITQFSKFNQPVALPVPVYQSSSIELNHNDSVIGFEFAVMDFTAPEKNRFRYKLEGFNDGWIETNDTHQVTYTNLDAGQYRFLLQGSNNDGVWNQAGTSIRLSMNPPIWATWWAYAIYLVLALVLIYQGLKVNEARLRREAEKRYSARLQLYIESLEEASDCVLIADANKNLMYSNNPIENILGISPALAVGRSIMSLLFSDPADASMARVGLRHSGRWHGEVQSRRGTEQVTTEITIAAVHDDNDNETAFVSIARDVTDRKKVEEELEGHRMNLQALVDVRTTALKHEISENKAVQRELANSLQEKELLLKEVHHRVKNNMQVISSLLNIQAETVANQTFTDLLGESQQRIKSMSLIHENLYQSDNLLEIDFEDYINMLANSLHRFYSVQDVIVSLDIQVDNVALDIETAVPCGLIINELISNSLKHAFKGRTGKGQIYIHFRSIGCQYVLEIGDNGNGLPGDFSVDSTTSMGMEIVSILTQQIDGQLTFDSNEGASFKIAFPKKEKHDQVAASR